VDVLDISDNRLKTLALRHLVGDPELLLASIYSVQGQAGNLIDASPAQRAAAQARVQKRVAAFRKRFPRFIVGGA
jgi:hypothetical protein